MWNVAATGRRHARSISSGAPVAEDADGLWRHTGLTSDHHGDSTMSLRKYPPVGIMFALDKELRRYLDRLTGYDVHNVAGLEIFEGKFADHRVLLTNGGLGKVNASIAAT
jgi:hypothetical protein